MGSFTEQDTKSDFERMKKGEIYWDQVRGFNDEHKHWIIRNMPKSTFLSHPELMNDDMLKELIISGNGDFYGHKENNEEMNERVATLNLIEDDWIQGIKKHKDSYPLFLFTDSFFNMVINCAPRTTNVAEAMFYKNPIYLIIEWVHNILLTSDKKYEYTDYLFHQLLDGELKHMSIYPSYPIGPDTWDYVETHFEEISNKAYWLLDKFYEHPGCTSTLRRKAIESDEYVPKAIKNTITAEEFILWFELYGEKRGLSCNNIRKFNCKEWDKVVTLKPEIFQYLHRPKVKVCQAAIKAMPSNIQYISNPSDKLKQLAVSLDPECKKYVELTKKDCKAIGIPFEPTEQYPEKYYLVKFYEDLCDEGDLNCSLILEGKEMRDFMNKSFTISFGNLYDDKIRKVRDCASVEPLTEEEYQVLKKFGYESEYSGYFNFDIDEDEE